MEREEAVAVLEREFGIRGGQFYLLEVIPLVEMLWADGRNQDEEVNLVHEFLDDHIARLNAAAQGEQVISGAELNDFLDRFVNCRPPSDFLRALRQLADSVVFNPASSEEREQRKTSILDYCMDIAAAAVTDYPYPRHARIVEEEKRLLRDLIAELQLSPRAETG